MNLRRDPAPDTTHWPAAAVEEIRLAYEAGIPILHIARGVGLARQIINRWVKRRGWTVKPFRLSQEAHAQCVAKGKIKPTEHNHGPQSQPTYVGY